MQTFVVMAIVYFVFMMGGAFGYRVPATGWKPAGWTPPAGAGRQRHDHAAPRAREEGLGHPAVLAGLDGADA